MASYPVREALGKTKVNQRDIRQISIIIQVQNIIWLYI
jgi:hypothetical protein